ncbi:MAG TPA: glycosyltransferase family 1 protein [Gammaproteobacteria bacterium]
MHADHGGAREDSHMPETIALISEHASPLAALGGVDSGGQNVYVGQLANHLTALGYGVDVFTRRDCETLPESVRLPSGARVIHVRSGPPRYVAKEDLLPLMDDFGERMLRYCRRCGGYDLVHANFWTSGMVALRMKERLGTPFVVTFHALGRVRTLHQAEQDRFPTMRPALEERIIAGAERVIAECPQDRHDLVQLYGASPDSIATIPCGFDETEFWPLDKRYARRILHLHPDEPILLQLGRIVPRKGIETAIRSLACLAERHGIRARLLVVGGQSSSPDPVLTPEIGRLRAIAETAGVGDQVIFTGSRERDVLRHYYSAADIFITTPWYEPFGITPLEAMACARPVIGSRVGGIKSTVVDGQTGFLVPPRDPAAVADRAAELLCDRQRTDAFGAAGWRRAKEHFTWPHVAARIAELYREVRRESPRQQPLWSGKSVSMP